MPNRLADATSPYLQQHRDNPVDWFEWGPDAFEEARRRDVPVLLSVGYAACHWCHVMAHESFEDQAVARLMNERFVNVKVDREERPDVDAVYMAATQLLTGSGGWPMTVFLTPQGRPFHAGTYYPPRRRYGMPSFTDVLTALSEVWASDRGRVEEAGGRLTEALAAHEPPVGERPPLPEELAAAVELLAEEEDAEHGGFGAAPKFPPSAVCLFLARHAGRARVSGGDPATGRLAEDLLGRTLRAMAAGGLYDQVAGGFARYSVDRAWVVPHFEKMLYDNALLARCYLHWWRLTGEPAGARVALETCDWMVEALGTPQGGFASSLDADTPVVGADGRTRGVEGHTYVWTPGQLVEVLGPEDGAWAARLLGVTAGGTFESGTSTLRLVRDPWTDPAEEVRWRAVRARLAVARTRRPQPGRDDKVVAAWNGLAIAALAETGALLDRPDLVAAAERAADLLLSVHLEAAGGPVVRLRRVSRDGRPGAPGGVLEDYGDVAEGLLALHAVTGEPAWLEVAGGLLDTVLSEFREDGSERLRDTPARDTDPALAAVRSPWDPLDTATPSGTSAAAGALLSYAALTGSSRHREAAGSALRVVAELAGRAPRAAGWGLAVSEALLDGPREVAVAGVPGEPGFAALHRLALAGTAPGAVISAGTPDAEGVPLLAGRTSGAAAGGAATAYVCRGFVCSAPTTDPAVLAGQVGARGAAAGSG